MMILLMMSQVVVNQFGFDRGGFRVFVLSPANRRDILLGKNLAVAPLTLGLGFTLALIVEIVFPMRLDRFLAIVPQFVSMYLLACLVANWSSILAPIAIAPGSFKPAHMKGSVILIQLLFAMLFPIVMLPTLLPMLLDVALEASGVVSGLPIALTLSVGLCVAVVFLYRLLLQDQGRLLQTREQKILATVTVNAEG
jgi:ABC-2 type transport system permease protein